MQRKRRPWALLLPGERRHIEILIEHGERLSVADKQALSEISALDEFVCFTPQPKSVMQLTDARNWTAKQRRERILEIRLDNGPKIATLPNDILPENPDDGFVAWSTYLEWLATYDVWPTKRTSWASLAKHLWLATLTKPIRFDGGEVGRAGFYGGRKQTPFPTLYRQTRQFDIRGAYSSALGNFPIPRKLVAAKPSVLSSSGVDGIGFATVRLPAELGEWGPLPVRRDRRSVRVLSWPTEGELEGWWTFNELRQAIACGASVTIHSAFAGQHSYDYFTDWQNIILRGRALRNGAAALAKNHANLLWSLFAVSPSRIFWKRYRDEYGKLPTIIKTQEAGPDFAASTAFLSSIVAARIRTRMFQEVLAPNNEPDLTVIHVDTDGYISGRSSQRTVGEKPGEWRHVRDMQLCDIRAAGSYRYTCVECGNSHRRWHYVCAGISEDSAHRHFREVTRSMEEQALHIASYRPEELGGILDEYRPKKRIRRHANIGDS